MRKLQSVLLALAVVCPLAQAQSDSTPARAAIDEAHSVHSIATAARLCNLITEADLNRALARMDRVHASQMQTNAQQETYLILRSSDSFRNMVFASALKRAQQDSCKGQLAAVWGDVEATLVQADVLAGQTLARAGSAPQAR